MIFISSKTIVGYKDNKLCFKGFDWKNIKTEDDLDIVATELVVVVC